VVNPHQPGNMLGLRIHQLSRLHDAGDGRLGWPLKGSKVRKGNISLQRKKAINR
jgi:hypothetical protein